MQRTGTRRLVRRTLIVLTAFLMTLSLVQVGLAFSPPPYESTPVGPYTADLVDFWYDYDGLGGNVSTWVYAVTVTGDIGDPDPESALSHFSLGLETCGVSEPDSGDIYTTTTTMMIDPPNNTEVCGTGPDQYNCVEGVYYIEGNGMQGTWPVVKFETLIEGLMSVGSTHLFVVKVDNATEGMEVPGSTLVATKAATTTHVSHLTGPYCQPTAVEVTSLSAGTSAQMPIILLGLVAAAGATGTTLFKEIKRRD